MTMAKSDREELAVLDDFEKGELSSVATKQELARIKEAASTR